MPSKADQIFVNTVTGPLPVDKLGITLFHEHFNLSNQRAYRPHPDPRYAYLEKKPVSMEDLALLREYPYASRDNLDLMEMETLAWELEQYQHEGGKSVVEVTGWNSQRDPHKMHKLALETGLNIIIGCGLYREASFPEWAVSADEVEIAERIVREIQDGIPLRDGVIVRPGVIGEIGIERGFSAANRKALRAAARAQMQTGVPLTVHLPGWERYGHEVVDICEAAGVNPRALILDHMDPSSGDPQYQLDLAKRGVFLEFDGIGMGLFLYQEKQSPCDQEIAQAVVRLLEAGYGNQLLLSQDVFLKIQWRSFGGNGYAHVLRSFLPRLKLFGVSDAVCRSILVENPRQAFINAAGSTRA
jgi:phosphotriesterase-related protein